MKKTTKKMSDKKYITLLVVAFFICNILGYALISSSVKWEQEKSPEKFIWDVSFRDVRVIDGSVEALFPATISKTGNEVNYIADLINYGDYYAFEVDVFNDGNIDAKVDSIFKSSLSLEQQRVFDYEVKYEDGRLVSKNDMLKVGEIKTVIVSVKYKDDVSLVDLSTDIALVNLSFSINYVQAD